LFEPSSYYAACNRGSLKILDNKSSLWTELAVLEKGVSQEKKTEYFKWFEGARDQHMPVLSKFIQVNATDLYLIGGNLQYPSLLARHFLVGKSCLKIHLKTGELTQEASMQSNREGFGVCLVGHRILVVGGYDKK